jgi:hypothetical protein
MLSWHGCYENDQLISGVELGITTTGMLKKRTLSRRERVQQRLNESAGIKDTVTRRIMAYVTLILFVSSGGGMGMLLVSIAGLLVRWTGPLLQAWRGKEEPGSLYVFGPCCCRGW